MLFYSLISMLIPLLLLLLSLMMNPKFKMNMIMLHSPFECGFNPLIKSRSPFSIQFFMVAILFLIFDIEVVLSLPIPLIKSNMFQEILSVIIIIMVLMLGLLIEWVSNSLLWK